MKVYLYDEKTKEYLYELEARIDPLESKKQGKDVWLLPANSTFDEPLDEKEGYAVIYDNGWKYIKDYRGKKYINGNMVEEIQELGEFNVLTEEQLKQIESGDLIIENGELKEKSKEKIAEEKRTERNYLLQSTDKYMLSDYPITEEQREQYKQYRQYLRDVPSSDNFPDIEIKNFENWKGA